MTSKSRVSKSRVFLTFHKSSAFSIAFADGSSKRSIGIGTVNLTSFALTDFNYIPHDLFNHVSVSHLTKTLQFYITFLSLCTVKEFQTKKVMGEGMSKMVYIIFNSVINLKWALLLWHVMSLRSSDTYV